MTRETDRDRTTLGEIEPYFAVLSEDKYRRDRLDDAALADFWLSGERDVEHYLASTSAYFGDVPIAEALDFGCGVGRIAKAIAARTSMVVGVDVSAGMLAEARKHAPHNLELTDTIPDRQFDWINSIIVFQHIPPERGYGLFAALLDRVRPGGVFSIQTTFSKDETYLPQRKLGRRAAEQCHQRRERRRRHPHVRL